MSLNTLHLLLAVAALTASTSPSAKAAEPASAPAARSNLQGDQRAWIGDPQVHALYDLTVKAFADGPDRVDRTRYEADSRRIFRELGASMGVAPGAMEEHLKLIPGQMIKIAAEDPQVLASFDSFVTAVFGPQ